MWLFWVFRCILTRWGSSSLTKLMPLQLTSAALLVLNAVREPIINKGASNASSCRLSEWWGLTDTLGFIQNRGQDCGRTISGRCFNDADVCPELSKNVRSNLPGGVVEMLRPPKTSTLFSSKSSSHAGAWLWVAVLLWWNLNLKASENSSINT